MKASNGSNVASPQALAITALATRYLLDNEFSVEPQLGEAVDALLVEEDEETLQTISLLLYEKDPEASEDFWDYARERAEMFLTEEGQVSTLFAVPVRHPEFMQGFSAERATASFFTHGLVCANAKVTFYPAPVDGGQLLNMSPVEVFRLHTALGVISIDCCYIPSIDATAHSVLMFMKRPPNGGFHHPLQNTWSHSRTLINHSRQEPPVKLSQKFRLHFF